MNPFPFSLSPKCQWPLRLSDEGGRKSRCSQCSKPFGFNVPLFVYWHSYFVRFYKEGIDSSIDSSFNVQKIVQNIMRSVRGNRIAIPSHAQLEQHKSNWLWHKGDIPEYKRSLVALFPSDHPVRDPRWHGSSCRPHKGRLRARTGTWNLEPVRKQGELLCRRLPPLRHKIHPLLDVKKPMGFKKYTKLHTENTSWAVLFLNIV